MVTKANKGITIVGLGPGGRNLLTVEADDVLKRAKEVYVRTVRHPVVGELPSHLTVHSFDHVYDEKATFEEVYQTIADEVLRLGQRREGVIYAVPGHPLVAEESVRLILARATEQVIPARVIEGLSFLDPTFTALGLDPFNPAVQLFDAAELALVFERGNRHLWSGRAEAQEQPDPVDTSTLVRSVISPKSPLLLAQVYSRSIASEVKLALMGVYPDDHEVTLVRAAGINGQASVESVLLFDIDRRAMDHLTALYVPPLKLEEDLASLEAFRAIISKLRGPNGCPWDREQTTESLKPYLLEESYEVLDAIDSGDPDKLAEELGDLLLQIVLHAQLAAERDDFTMEDVIRGISAKIIRRHPHVFGHWSVSGSADVMRNWEQIKRTEREGTKERKSAISSIPKATPALAYAQVLQRRAARAGFDWPEISGVLDKVREEIEELRQAQNSEERQAEYGDILFSLVNLARWLSVDAEESLRMANHRFLTRFHRMEEMAEARGQDFSKLSLDEQEKLWQEAKG